MTAAAGRMRLVRWPQLRKGALRGFAAVELSIGLEIVARPVQTNHGKTWATPPGKAQIDQDGGRRRDGTGEPLYVGVFNCRRRKLHAAFSNRVELVRAYDPDSLVDTHA